MNIGGMGGGGDGRRDLKDNVDSYMQYRLTHDGNARGSASAS